MALRGEALQGCDYAVILDNDVDAHGLFSLDQEVFDGFVGGRPMAEPLKGSYLPWRCQPRPTPLCSEVSAVESFTPEVNVEVFIDADVHVFSLGFSFG
jgi:hypothetical protein